MREIKFRGKSKENNKWVYGGLSKHNDENYFIVNTLKDHIGFITHMQEITPETLGQYTGLRDKNSKEIYEGDIAKHTYKLNNEEKKKIFVIVYDMASFQCKAPGENFSSSVGFYATLRNGNGLEIIGNIHDNPELLSNG